MPVKVLFELLQGVGFQAWLQLAVEVGGIVSVVLVQDAIKLKKTQIQLRKGLNVKIRIFRILYLSELVNKFVRNGQTDKN